MHVGIVHYAAPPMVGGVELTIYHHARILLALGHQVTVVAGKGDAFLPGVIFREEPLAGSRHPAILEMGQALAAGEVPAGFERLVETLVEHLLAALHDCDVVIGHNLFTLHKNLPLTAAVHRLVGAGRGPRWVAWHHDFAWLRSQYRPVLHDGRPWDLLREPWPNVRHVTVSAAQREELAALYGLPAERIESVPPGIDPVSFFRLNQRVARILAGWRVLEADCLFLLPARITRRKNIELGLHWLAAFRDLAGWDARLLVTGPPGPHNPTNRQYLEELLALREALDLVDRVHFVYQAAAFFPEMAPDEPLLLTDEEVVSLYDVADALLFPSEQEGFGIPLLEAALARLPIFATDLPSFHESTAGEGTFFSAATLPEQVARTMLRVLEGNPAFRLRRNVIQHFTWQRLVETRLLPLLLDHAGP